MTQQATTAAALAREFLAALEALDIDRASSVFRDDTSQEMPFSPGNFPKRLEGIEALRRQYGGLPDAYASMQFPIRHVYEPADGTWAVVEDQGVISQRDGRRYDNTYIGVFRADAGRSVHFTEYFDPIVLQEAFGDDLAETFTLDGEAR
jgi:uncharacterized protein